VRELRHLVVDRADDLFAAVHADVGRPPLEVLATELLPTASALKYQEKRAARVLAPRRVGWRLQPTWLMGCRDVVYRRPWGLVGVIGTWNYPLYLNIGPIAAALTAGNGVLWKPSENAPRTAKLIHRLFLEAGYPAVLFALLPATREAGPLVAEADVEHVVFTGSDAVGRKLAARLGERLIPSTLELSGCDPLFVLEDADVTLAAHAAWFAFTLNRGQTCIAARRVFVHRSRYAEFADVLKPLAAASAPMALVGEGQRVQAERLIADATARGAAAFGNNPSPGPSPFRGGEQDGRLLSPPSLAGKGAGGLGSFFPPTILLDATPDMAICREASFAPITAVIPFDTIDNAVSLAASCPSGLAASVFTRDGRAGEALAERLACGSVSINDVLAPTAHPATPFGGRGASGWGVTQGPEGLLAMTVPQAVSVRRWGLRPHIDEAVKPDPAATTDILRGLLRASHARGVRAWLGGVRQLLRGLRRKK
jgi:acyl-CoA reductase-like NAD-dependent aldehyde dehydrogenase